jgi:two-component system, OmpR family, response regulator
MESEIILVVDDDREIRTLLSEYLRQSGYTVATAANAIEMFSLLASVAPALIILDVMMPGQDGVAACRELRSKSNVPIIMLTALGEPIERTIGLEVGADDYMGKPFLPRELLARVRAILRRGPATAQSADKTANRHLRQFSQWQIDLDRCQVFVLNGAEITLTTAEYRLLLVFIERPQRVLSRDMLLQLTHSDSAESFDRSIDVLISRLRSKFGDQARTAKLIRTVRGGGYMFIESVTTVTESAAPGNNVMQNEIAK